MEQLDARCVAKRSKVEDDIHALQHRAHGGMVMGLLPCGTQTRQGFS